MNIYIINVNIIREWAEELEKKNISISYMNKIHNILKNIFNFAIKNYNLKSNPATMYGRFQNPSNKRKDKKIRYMLKEQFDIFISIIEELMWKTFFIFLFYTGCRKGETLALKWKHINFDKREILIKDNPSFDNKREVIITTTKTRKERIIKMSNFLYESLLLNKKEMQKYSDFSEKWFVFGNTIHLGKSNIDRHKKKYFELSGLEEITTHEFRHSHVSLLINEYVKRSIERAEKPDMAKFFLMMSDRMGHTIEVMQNTYMHLFPTVQDEIVDLLDNL